MPSWRRAARLLEEDAGGREELGSFAPAGETLSGQKRGRSERAKEGANARFSKAWGPAAQNMSCFIRVTKAL